MSSTMAQNTMPFDDEKPYAGDTSLASDKSAPNPSTTIDPSSATSTTTAAAFVDPITSLSTAPNDNRPAGYPTEWEVFRCPQSRCAECYQKFISPAVRCKACKHRICENCFDNGGLRIKGHGGLYAGLWKNLEGCWCQYQSKHPPLLHERKSAMNALAKKVRSLRASQHRGYRDRRYEAPIVRKSKKRAAADEAESPSERPSKVAKASEDPKEEVEDEGVYTADDEMTDSVANDGEPEDEETVDEAESPSPPERVSRIASA